jgi:hypothetical protein
MILGNEVIYSLSMFLFAGCMIRLYIVIKFMKYWSQFTNEKALRMFKLFNNKLIYVFFYKTSIKEYSFIALAVIFFAFIYLSSLIFKIFEHYNPLGHLDNETIKFSYFLNCLWYLVVTMTTSKSVLTIVGYGDYTPITMIGRIIGVCCCITGIILTALVVFTLMVYIQFTEENEFTVNTQYNHIGF